MRGSRAVLAAVAVAMILAASPAWTQDELQISVDKSVSSGASVIKFEGVTYWIYTQGDFYVSFTRIDNNHHRIYVAAKPGLPTPYYPISVQWGIFSPVSLELESGGEDSWLLGLETGYAEK